MLRVLIVDDSRVDREILLGNLPEKLFKECDFLEAESISMARRVLAIKDVDVIALDLSLPDSDGFETFFTMKQMAKGAAIVILSGNDDDSLAKKLIAHGADSYILKGTVDPHGVYRTLTNAAVRAKCTIRVTEDEAMVTRRAQTAARNMIKTYRSGEMLAVKEASLSEALSTNTDLTVLILEKQARMSSDITELKSATARLDERMNAHDDEKQRLSIELSEGRKEMKSFTNEVNALKTDTAVAKTKHEALEKFKESAHQHRGKIATLLTTIVTSPFWGPKLVEGIIWLMKHFVR